MPTRRASSTLVIRPSSCSSLRICRSMASRRAATEGSGIVPGSPIVSNAGARCETLLLKAVANHLLGARFHNVVAFWSAYLAWLLGTLNCAEHRCAFRPSCCQGATPVEAKQDSGGRLGLRTVRARTADSLRHRRNLDCGAKSASAFAARPLPQSARRGLFSMGRINHARLVIIGSGAA